MTKKEKQALKEKIAKGSEKEILQIIAEILLDK